MEKEKNKNAVEALKNYTGYVLYLKKILSNWPMCFIIKNTIKAKWCYRKARFAGIFGFL